MAEAGCIMASALARLAAAAGEMPFLAIHSHSIHNTKNQSGPPIMLPHQSLELETEK